MSDRAADTAVRPAVIDQKLVRALSHPLRVSILEVLHGRLSSPTRIAQELRQSLGVVVYHVRVLVEVGAIEHIKKENRGGASENFYASSPNSMIGDQGWRAAPLAIRPGVSNEAVRHFFGRMAAAMDAGTVDRRDETTLNWMPLTLDEQGWSETTALLRRTRDILSEIHQRSCVRLGETGVAGMPVVAGLAAFEAAPAGEPGDFR